MRVKPPLGRLTAADARALAEGARAYGNGGIELTGRGALQFRGMTAESAQQFAEMVVRRGLAHGDAAVERRRSVVVAPLAAARVAGLAEALEAAVVANDGLVGLPAKFWFGVDVEGADVGLRVGAEDCLIVPDGAGLGAVVSDGEAVGAVLRVAHACLALMGGGRMRGVGAQVLEAAGLVPVPLQAGVAGVDPRVKPGDDERVRPGMAEGWFGVGVAFGDLGARTLGQLAEMGTGLRLTPWRVILLEGAPDEAALAGLGLIVAADDPRWGVSACVGAPGCASGSVATRELAGRLRGDVHVSGCSKGCAHPGPAALTLVGREGRFDVVRGGRAGDVPVQRGLTAAEVMRLQ